MMSTDTISPCTDKEMIESLSVYIKYLCVHKRSMLQSMRYMVKRRNNIVHVKRYQGIT